MSLARSFTKRFARGDKHDKQAPSNPPRISSPVSLLATSNSQASSALDLADAQMQHAMRPFHPPEITADRFAGFASPTPGNATPRMDQTPQMESPSQEIPGLTDASSIEESSPVQPSRDYFDQPLRTKTIRQVSSSSSLSQESTADIPAIPKRAPSHSKREHVRLHRSRSVQRQSIDSAAPSLSSGSHASNPSSAGPGTPRESISNDQSDWRSSFDIIGRSGSLMSKNRNMQISQSPRSRSVERSNTVAGTRNHSGKHENPFSKELEQLEEVAEEFTGVADLIDRDVDESTLVSKGLAKFSADEYISEIGALHGVFFSNDTRTALVNEQGNLHGWI